MIWNCFDPCICHHNDDDYYPKDKLLPVQPLKQQPAKRQSPRFNKCARCKRCKHSTACGWVCVGRGLWFAYKASEQQSKEVVRECGKVVDVGANDGDAIAWNFERANWGETSTRPHVHGTKLQSWCPGNIIYAHAWVLCRWHGCCSHHCCSSCLSIIIGRARRERSVRNSIPTGNVFEYFSSWKHTLTSVNQHEQVLTCTDIWLTTYNIIWYFRLKV